MHEKSRVMKYKEQESPVAFDIRHEGSTLQRTQCNDQT